jgi:hypothetical protein
MKEKVITVSGGKFINVYDDVFSYQDRFNLLNFFKKSLYRPTSGDTYNDDQFYSAFSATDLENTGIKSVPGFKEICDKFNFFERDLKQIRVNITTPAEKNRIHADGFGLTFIYYANLEWQVDWGGHTMFLDDSLQEAEFVSVCKPNRVVMFDGSIPHMIMTPSNLCPTLRYAFVIQAT